MYDLACFFLPYSHLFNIYIYILYTTACSIYVYDKYILYLVYLIYSEPVGRYTLKLNFIKLMLNFVLELQRDTTTIQS